VVRFAYSGEMSERQVSRVRSSMTPRMLRTLVHGWLDGRMAGWQSWGGTAEHDGAATDAELVTHSWRYV
jgi:hypothetical protein